MKDSEIEAMTVAPAAPAAVEGRMKEVTRYACRVRWSAQDDAFVATCAEFPSLSWQAASRPEALRGLKKLLREVLADMRQQGEEVPKPAGALEGRMNNPRRHLAGGKLRLTRAQWGQLSERMHGENLGGWILSAGYRHHGGTYDPCVAITVNPDDVSTLTILLTHLIEVTADPQDRTVDMEDLRYLADQVQVFKPGAAVYPTYYLPCVTVEKVGAE